MRRDENLTAGNALTKFDDWYTADIAAGIPSGIARLLALTSQGSIGMPTAVSIVIGALLLIYIVVYFESAQHAVDRKSVV